MTTNRINSKKNASIPHSSSANFEEISQWLDQLSEEHKLLIRKKLLNDEQGINIVLNGNGSGSNNVIQNSLVIQTGGSNEELSSLMIEKLDKVSPEILDDLLIAIAKKIKARSEEDLE